MATHHASSGEIIDLRPIATLVDDGQSTTLVRDEQLKVIRFVLPTGKELPEHAVDGPITMHCLEGAVDVTAHGSCKPMRAGDESWMLQIARNETDSQAGALHAKRCLIIDRDTKYSSQFRQLIQG